MKLWRCLLAGAALTAMLPAAASAQWNAANDEANRQSMMADMRASAAANDRANFDSQQAQQADAARFNSGSGSDASAGGSGAAGGSLANPGYAPRATTGPQSVVATYSFIIHRQESPAALLARLESEAVSGNALSAFNLGRVLYTGFDGAPRDETNARRWFGEAARLGHPGAQSQYGQMLYNGLGGVADQVGAMSWLKKAADQGDSYGQALYGFWTLSTQVKSNPDVIDPEAVGILVKAAEAGQLVAQAYLGGSVYRLGFGAPADREKAAHYSLLAANQGLARAQADLGRDYIYGSGIPKDYNFAVTWLRKAAAQNNPDAVLLLGRLAIDGAGMPQDVGGGVRMVKQAADAGNMEAIGFYGVLLQLGVGVPKDEVAGATMLERAAQSHDPDAEQNYAIAWFNGQGMAKNEATGVYWQKRAADDGNVYAAATYCARATTGMGMPKNAVEGIRYGRIAAQADLPRAQTCLGWAYHDGNGVAKDLVISRDWFRKAAVQGDQTAIDLLKTDAALLAAGSN